MRSTAPNVYSKSSGHTKYAEEKRPLPSKVWPTSPWAPTPPIPERERFTSIHLPKAAPRVKEPAPINPDQLVAAIRQALDFARPVAPEFDAAEEERDIANFPEDETPYLAAIYSDEIEQKEAEGKERERLLAHPELKNSERV